MHRAIAGSWTEYMHTDEELHHKAMLRANGCEFSSHRTCPFFQKGAGTLRHYVMMCAEMKLYTESICEAVEAELCRRCCRERMILEGQTFHSKKLPVAFEEDLAIADRWSILRARRWLVRDSEKE